MTTLPLSEVKAHLSEIAEEVARTHDRVRVTRNGRDYVVLLSARDLESLEATIELLSDATAIERLRTAEADIARGEGATSDDMESIMRERKTRGV